MRYRTLGSTGLKVSEIGLGCASWWGRAEFSETEALALVHAAIEGGVTFFDTGASYSKGQAEQRLGRALAGRATDKLVIGTKAGTYFDGRRVARDMSPTGVTRSVEASLRNLGLDALPLLQLHGPSLTELTDDLMACLVDLKTRGLVRALGANSFDEAVLERAATLADIEVVMLDYNVLRPRRGALIARLAASGKGVLAGMAMAMGHADRQVLKLRRPRDIWYGLRALRHHRGDVARGLKLSFLGQVPGMSGPQAALAYVLANSGVSCAVIGTTRMAHLQENLAASGLSLPAEVVARIETMVT